MTTEKPYQSAFEYFATLDKPHYDESVKSDHGEFVEPFVILNYF